MDNGFLTIQDKSATNEIRDNYIVYGGDVLINKFPNIFDGLKSVTRRILWNTRVYGSVMTNMTSVIGNTAAFHEGGDSSVYDALIRLGQNFMVGHPLISVQGRVGSYRNPKGAAAPRYLKAKLSDFAWDVYFNGIHLKTIPMTDTKEFGSLEPSYLIPKVPTALVTGNLTVGFGFKSFIPMLDFADVCDLVTLYSEHFRAGNVGIPPAQLLAKHLIPTFPIKNLVKNRTELLKQYSQGNFTYPIDIEGWVDMSGNNITLRAVPYGKDFDSVTFGLRKLLKDDKLYNHSKHWIWNYVVSVNQYSTKVAEVSIDLKKGVNPFEALEKLRPLLSFEIHWKPIYNFIKDKRALTIDPTILIYLWYQERSLSISGGLKYKQFELLTRKITLEALLIIVGAKLEVAKIISESEDDNDSIQNLRKRFPRLSANQAHIILHQNLKILAKCNRKQIESDLEETIAELEEVNKSFGRIHEIIANDAAYLKKKYGSTSETKFSEDFIGYIQYGNLGVIQFFDTEMMYELLNTKWPAAVEKTIHLYDPKRPLHFALRQGKLELISNNSKEIWCEGIQCFSTEPYALSLIIGDDGNTIVMEKQNFAVVGQTTCPISKEFYAIRRNGKVYKELASNLSMRKSVSRGAKTDIIYGLPDKTKEVIVFHMNSTAPNQLRLDRIISGDNLGELITTPSGHERILGVYPVNTKHIYINIPNECKRGISIDHLEINDLNSVVTKLQQGNHMIVELAVKGGKHYHLKKNSVVRTIALLEVK